MEKEWKGKQFWRKKGRVNRSSEEKGKKEKEWRLTDQKTYSKV